MNPRPHPKVAGAGVGGAGAVVLVDVLAAAGVHVDQQLAAALATLCSFAAGYLTPGGNP